MDQNAATPCIHPEVLPAAPEQEAILANLLELYIHDFSEFLDVDVGPDGRFGYKDLPLYWREPGRHPLLVRMDETLVGFALVKRESGMPGDVPAWDMAEFFVVRGHRRCGIGTKVAHEVWRRFPGSWQVRVMQSNASGCGFWEQAIRKYAGQAMDCSSVDKGGKAWRRFTFVAAAVT